MHEELSFGESGILIGTESPLPAQLALPAPVWEHTASPSSQRLASHVHMPGITKAGGRSRDSRPLKVPSTGLHEDLQVTPRWLSETS